MNGDKESKNIQTWDMLTLLILEINFVCMCIYVRVCVQAETACSFSSDPDLK